jgi:hypothetical protein
MTAAYDEDEVYVEKLKWEEQKRLERERIANLPPEERNVHDGYDYSKGERVGPSKSWGI